MAPQCTWPDVVRRTDRWEHTYPWHFINLEDGEEYYSRGAVNPQGDVLQALLLAEAKLLDPAIGEPEKRIYLLFLAHLAGDAHQPLHVGRRSDLGGNRVDVTWFGQSEFDSVTILLAPGGDCDAEPGLTPDACLSRLEERRGVNLHKVWDLLMIERFITSRGLRPAPGDSEFRHRAYADALDRRRRLGRAARAGFSVWIDESMRLRERAYATGDGDLGDRYYRRNIRRLNQRVALAGRRLAATLNGIFGADRNSARATRRTAEHRALRARLVELTGGRSPLADLE